MPSYEEAGGACSEWPGLGAWAHREHLYSPTSGHSTEGGSRRGSPVGKDL